MSYKALIKLRDSKVILLKAFGKTRQYDCQIKCHVNPEKWTKYLYKLHDFHGGGINKTIMLLEKVIP